MNVNIDITVKVRTANKRLAQWRVTWLIEYSTLNQICGELPVVYSEIRNYS
ncbi:hypothetical protein [Peijinzhouia sedimentorum]